MSKLVWLVGLGMAGVMAIAATSRGDDAPAAPSRRRRLRIR